MTLAALFPSWTTLDRGITVALFVSILLLGVLVIVTDGRKDEDNPEDWDNGLAVVHDTQEG